MDIEGIRFDRLDVGAALASRSGMANLARILERWTESRRPAVLFVLVGETPFADVYAEEVLRNIFPDAPVLRDATAESDATGVLRVYVADGPGTSVYVIADPMASERELRTRIENRELPHGMPQGAASRCG